MKFILTRHTTTKWSSAGRIQGQTDIGLSPEGEAEAKELAKSLYGIEINSIVSSDLKRASETAKIVNSRLAAPLQLDERLRECSFGKIEGLTKQQALDQYGPSVAINLEDQYRAYDFRPFGGEHRDGVLLRHIEVLKSLAKEKPDNATLLVGHSRGLATLLYWLGQPPDLKRGEYKIIEYGSH